MLKSKTLSERNSENSYLNLPRDVKNLMAACWGTKHLSHVKVKDTAWEMFSWGLGLRPWNKFTQEMRAAFDMNISIWGKLLCLLNNKCIMHSSHAVKFFFPSCNSHSWNRKILRTSSYCHLASCISGKWSGSRCLIISWRDWACRIPIMKYTSFFFSFAYFFRWKGYRCFNKW